MWKTFKNECADGGWRKNGEVKKEKRIFPEENCFNGICMQQSALSSADFFCRADFHESHEGINIGNIAESYTGGSESGL